MEYIGEHLLPGQIGHAFIILSFVASLLASIAYFFATQKRETDLAAGWKKIGRTAFTIHGFSLFGIIITIFYVMINQYYEYQYVQAHVSDELPLKYIASAFWEGQEGSFLLWMFWHVILGFVLMFKAKNWETSVMAVVALVQVFIGSMILGLYFQIEALGIDYKLGSNPLLLLRDTMDVPLFNKADYVELIKGTGLNPLLQNYWMTIHPPTLFLGFASTVVPFAFAVAGLWTNRHKEWLKPALSWALFSGAILGTGILMGGAWAYEALSFGGYWAWDPVENTSLVPWIILIAGIHTNLIAKNTGYSIRSTYVFYLLSFLMILYSTTLTRSGVLGDTSVHAFTEMGLSGQLFIFIASFTLLAYIPYFIKYKSIPSPKKEESVKSKEFWIFIGTLVLVFSSILITFTTSIPVYKKVAGLFGVELNITSPLDPVSHYNKYQLWIGVFVGILSGIAQYFRYKEFNWSGHSKKFSKHLIVSILIAGLLTFLTTFWISINAWQYTLLLFTGYFTIVVNLDYLINFVKGNLKMVGSSMAHIGFGIMIIGVIASGLNKDIISSNPFAQRGLLDDDMIKRNVLLLQGQSMFMSGYDVTYIGDTLMGHTRQYQVNYKRKNKAGKVIEEFDLYPNILYDKGFAKMAASNPSTKHYLGKDIFTHIASLPVAEIDAAAAKEKEDSLNYRIFEYPIGQEFLIKDSVKVGDSLHYRFFKATIEGINKHPVHPDYKPEQKDLAVGVQLNILDLEKNETFKAEPIIALRNTLLYNYPAQINDLSMKIVLTEQTVQRIFTIERDLDYKEFTFKEGDKINLNGISITFTGFNRNPNHKDYTPEKDDIAVSAMISAINPKTKQTHLAQPVYLIRDSKPMNLKDEIEPLGLHFRFFSIDPKLGTIKMYVAQSEKQALTIPIKLATNSFRTDYIVLEAIVFPGINLVWLGTIMMMLGLAVSMFFRIKDKRNVLLEESVAENANA